MQVRGNSKTKEYGISASEKKFKDKEKENIDRERKFKDKGVGN